MRNIVELIIVLFGLSLSYSSFGQTRIDSELDSLIVEGVFVNRYYQSIDDDSMVLPEEKRVVIDTQSDLFFIPNRNFNKKQLEGILRDVQSYELNRDEMYLIWDYSAEAFFLALSMPYSQAKIKRLKWPFSSCDKYEFNGVQVKTIKCKFKAYHKKVPTSVLKNQGFLLNDYDKSKEYVDIYLFYELIKTKCIKL